MTPKEKGDLGRNPRPRDLPSRSILHKWQQMAALNLKVLKKTVVAFTLNIADRQEIRIAG